MIPAETRRNFNDFNNMYREIELDEEVDIQDVVVERVTAELDQRRLDDVHRWRDDDHYLVAVGFNEDYDDVYDSGCDSDFEDNDVAFNHGFNDPGYGSDDENEFDDINVSDIED